VVGDVGTRYRVNFAKKTVIVVDEELIGEIMTKVTYKRSEL
jgi:hypothetical protein